MRTNSCGIGSISLKEMNQDPFTQNLDSGYCERKVITTKFIPKGSKILSVPARLIVSVDRVKDVKLVYSLFNDKAVAVDFPDFASSHQQMLTVFIAYQKLLSVSTKICALIRLNYFLLRQRHLGKATLTPSLRFIVLMTLLMNGVILKSRF